MDALDRLVAGIVFAFVVAALVVAFALARAAKRSEGQGMAPLLGIALGSFALGYAALSVWNDRTWHELLIETSTPVVRLLPPGITCESCRWEGYAANLSVSSKPLLLGAILAVAFAGPAFFYRIRAARAGQLDRARLWMSLDISLMFVALVAVVFVLWPPAGSPGWRDRDRRWSVLQVDELLTKNATAAGCALFWDKLASPKLNDSANLVMPSGANVESVVSSIASRCLLEPPPKESSTHAFFFSLAWKSASPAAQTAWLERRTAGVERCEALALPEVQCVIARRDPVPWKADAARCLETRGCYPFRGGTDILAKIITLGVLGDPDPRCGQHRAYLEAFAQSGTEGPLVSECEKP